MRRGFSLIELLIVISIILVIIMIAAPRYQKAQVLARETAAVKAIQTIHAAQVQYRSEYGCYAPSLLELGPPVSGHSPAKAAGLVSQKMANGINGSYRFSLNSTCDAYTLTSHPATLLNGKSFFSDETMTIRYSAGSEPATAQSPEFDN